MLPSKKNIISGWGNFPVCNTRSIRPEKQRDLTNIFHNSNTMLARGQGKSYGDASLNTEYTINTSRHNKFKQFDAEQGFITVQSGTTLAEILEVIIPKGWLLPVIPGTKYASIGGCFASDIHGKNHFSAGTIANHVTKLTLRTVSGEIINCSPAQNSDIFWASAGGMGMTGLIEDITLRLTKISSEHLQVHQEAVYSIEEMIARFISYKSTSDYMVGWIDHFVSGRNLGQGIFERASHVQNRDPQSLQNYTPKQPIASVPFFLPSFILNKYTMACYNKIKFANISKDNGMTLQSIDNFFHPLDNIKNWNRLYGKQGFLQYQFILPEVPNIAANLRHILQILHDSKLFSFLAVIKYYGPHQGLMSFPIEGFSVALDFPITADVLKLLDHLDEIVANLGGRVYLAKDARLSKSAFETMYQQYLLPWKKILRQLDPEAKIQSMMSKRLGFKNYDCQ